MEINVLYLYYDLLNLYGDSGNILAIKRHIENQNINCNIDYLSLEDNKDFKKYDLIYIGSGTDDNLLLALKDLIKYKSDLIKYINENKFILSTGNSIELFGKYIFNNKKINTLGIFDFYTSYNDKRIVKDVIYNSKISNSKIIGFENHRGVSISNENNFLFKNDLKEGIINKGFIGSYVIGPLLIRNPIFCEYYIKTIINFKFKNFKFKNFENDLELKAYEKTVDLLG